MKVEIYVKEGCNFCENATDWFLENRIPYIEIVVTHGNKKRISSMLTEKYAKRITTFPQIIIDNLYIGGYFDLMKKRKNILELKEKELNGDKNILKNGLYLLSKS